MGIFNFRKKKKPAQQKIAFAYINPGGSTVIWSSEDYTTLMTETFMKNVIAYQCINMISRAVASVKWYHMKKAADGTPSEVVNSELAMLFMKANIYEKWREFLYKTNCYYLGNGDAFVKRTRVGISNPSMVGGRIREMFSLRPDRVQIQKNQKNQVIGYVYQEDLQDQEIFPFDIVTGECDLLHIKAFNPIDDYFGMAPSQPISREIDISNEATRWNMHLMMNDARPGIIVMMKGFLPDGKYNDLMKILNEDHSGAANAGKSLVIESEEGIVDVKPYSFSPKDLDFVEGGRETARRIASGYGIPPMLLGIPGDNTYSNYKEARAAFWEDTVIYYLDMYKEALSGWIFNRDPSQYIDYDLDDVPALAYKRDLMWERALKSTDILTIDERRELIGYDQLENGQGKEILVSSSLMPLKYVIEPPEPPPDMSPGTNPDDANPDDNPDDETDDEE